MRLVRTLGAELGIEHGTVQRVAARLGYGTESVRSWVKQADVDDGRVLGVTTDEAARVKVLEQEVRELRRANEILYGLPPSWRSSTASSAGSGVRRRQP